MLERNPPRRDPRVLVVDARRHPATYAALDAWESRGVGELPRVAPSRGLERLLLKVRPSHVVVAVRGAAGPFQGLGAGLRTAHLRGLVVQKLTPTATCRLLARAPSVPTLVGHFPELRHLFADRSSKGTTPALRLAAALLLSDSLPPRTYAVSRLPAHPSSSVDR